MTATITRIDTAGITAQLERIEASGLLQKGCVNTIELDAIRRGLGDKWVRRREQVWEHVGRTVEASIGDTNVYLRLNETSFLICIAGREQAAAQAQCARILRDLLNFFLGSSAHADIVVRTVTTIGAGQITAAPVALRPDMLAEAACPDAAIVAGKHDKDVTPTTPPTAQAPPQNLPVVINSCGGPLSVRLGVERVFSLARSAFAAQRVKVEIVDLVTELEITPTRLLQLETAALTRIDQRAAILARRLLADPAHVNQALFMPISIQTAGNARGRSLVLETFRRDLEQAKRRLVLELGNMGVGTPNSRIAEVVTLVRPSVRAVFGRLDISDFHAQPFGGSGLMGFIVDIGSSRHLGSDLVTKFLGVSEIARSAASTLVVGPLPNDSFADVCRIVGATHVTFQAPLAPGQICVPVERPGTTPGAGGYHQIIYTSRARSERGADKNAALQSLMAVSATRNKAVYVTGLLLRYGDWFVQILEGSRAAVGATMERIVKDPRHERIEIVSAACVPEREFARWSMVGLLLPAGHQAIVESLPPEHRTDLGSITQGQALSLLRTVARLKAEEEDAQTKGARAGRSTPHGASASATNR